MTEAEANGATLLGRLLGPYAVLRGNRNLQLLFGGQVISTFGDWLYVIALVVLAYDLTGSATLVAALTFVRLLPYALFLPFSGVLADRGNRKALMIASDVKASREQVSQSTEWMSRHFYDIRMFGAVMTTGINAGQVRGPVQLTFARSVDPVIPQDLAITRVAITREEEREKKETEIGRKTLVPYGLYVGYGFYSPFFAKQSGVTQADLELFWDALVNMWDLDRSSARGMMNLRGLYVFTHERKLGNAPAHVLFERIRPTLNDGVASPRKFSDYTVDVDDNLPDGVTLTRLVG